MITNPLAAIAIMLAVFVIALCLALAIIISIVAIFNLAAACIANDEDVTELLEEEEEEEEADRERRASNLKAMRTLQRELQNGPLPTLAEGEDPYVAGLALYEAVTQPVPVGEKYTTARILSIALLKRDPGA